MPGRETFELPLVVDRPKHERADAARNRSALIEAATRLLRECGPEGLTMDAVACAAGVGKGTLFRRFGDRASLFRELLDESERALQEGFIRGPAPLGPGAPPHERIVAFGAAVMDHIACNAPLLLAAQPESIEARLGHPTQLAYRLHLLALLREAGVGEAAEYLADALLAALDPALVVHQRRALGMSGEDQRRGWEALVASVLTGTPRPSGALSA